MKIIKTLIITLFFIIFFSYIVSANDPVSYGIPDPVNRTVGVDTTFIWGLPISDPEGDTFNVSFECRNGQSMNWSDVNNGTYNITLSFLTYSTYYTIWANTSDVVNGTVISTYFSFTTEGRTGTTGGGGGSPVSNRDDDDDEVIPNPSSYRTPGFNLSGFLIVIVFIIFFKKSHLSL